LCAGRFGQELDAAEGCCRRGRPHRATSHPAATPPGGIQESCPSRPRHCAISQSLVIHTTHTTRTHHTRHASHTSCSCSPKARQAQARSRLATPLCHHPHRCSDRGRQQHTSSSSSTTTSSSTDSSSSATTTTSSSSSRSHPPETWQAPDEAFTCRPPRARCRRQQPSNSEEGCAAAGCPGGRSSGHGGCAPSTSSAAPSQQHPAAHRCCSFHRANSLCGYT
jgi:hypothetical protein